MINDRINILKSLYSKLIILNNDINDLLDSYCLLII